ncbi:peroxin 13 [Carex rostrata]
MATNSAPPGNGPPSKPWERAGSASGPAPFRPPSNGSTSDVVEASGTAKPGEVVSTVNRTTAATTNTLSRPVPPRPWEQNYGSTYGGGYGSSMYGGGYSGGYGGGYGGSMYGNNSMYSSGYGAGGLYGSSGNGAGGLYGSSGMYGGGSLYSGGLGRPMGYGGMGMGGMGMGPYGNQDDPNNPYGPPSQPPNFWMSFLRVMGGVVNFFGRIAVLIDQNTQAFHMFMTALLQLFDRSGVLYGELARFIFRLFGIRTTPRKNIGEGPPSFQGPKANNNGNSWDNVWGDDLAKGYGQ